MKYPQHAYFFKGGLITGWSIVGTDAHSLEQFPNIEVKPGAEVRIETNGPLPICAKVLHPNGFMSPVPFQPVTTEQLERLDHAKPHLKAVPDTAEGKTACPKCGDSSIVQRSRAPGLFVWVLDGVRDADDGLELEIDFCPWCGTELLDSDECGQLPELEPALQTLQRANHQVHELAALHGALLGYNPDEMVDGTIGLMLKCFQCRQTQMLDLHPVDESTGMSYQLQLADGHPYRVTFCSTDNGSKLEFWIVCPQCSTKAPGRKHANGHMGF